jgi:hypothetical protein
MIITKIYSKRNYPPSTLSKPLPIPQINLPPFLQISHNLINAPRLKLIPFRIIRRNTLVVLHPNTILEVLDTLLVVAMRVPFGVVLPDPLGQARRRLAWVDFDLSPVGFLQQLGVGEADFLGAGGAGESVEC